MNGGELARQDCACTTKPLDSLLTFAAPPGLLPMSHPRHLCSVVAAVEFGQGVPFESVRVRRDRFDKAKHSHFFKTRIRHPSRWLNQAIELAGKSGTHPVADTGARGGRK